MATLQQRMTAHVRAIAKRHNVAIEFTDRRGGRSWRKTRRVQTGRIEGRTFERRYAVALHELGHVIGAYPRTRMEKEAAAWEWATDNAIDWTPDMEAEMLKCLRSYREWAMRRQGRAHGRPVLPPVDHAFWRLLGEGQR